MLIWRNRMMPRSPYNNQPCTIVRELDRSEVDAETGPMFEVHFAEPDETILAFGDELIIPQHGRIRRYPSGASPLNPHVAKAIGRVTELSEAHVHAIADRQARGILLTDLVLLCRQDMDRR